MDITTVAERLNTWFTASYDIHNEIIEAGHVGDFVDRRDAEIRSLFAPRGEAEDGWGPLDPLEPPPTVAFQAKARRRLRKRQLFRIERYATPHGDLFRAWLSGNTKNDTDSVEEVLDIIERDGAPVVVARHEACFSCHGTAVRDGATCIEVNYGGDKCIGGLHPKGGAKIEVGERRESANFAVPKDRWGPLMER